MPNFPTAEGSVAIISMGSITTEAVRAADVLAPEDQCVGLAVVSTFKPLTFRVGRSRAQHPP